MLARTWRVLAPLLVLSLLAVACGGQGGETAGAETAAPVPPTTSTPPGGRQPSASDPLRVTFAGDSVMAELAPAMIQALEGTGESDAHFLLTPSVARGGADGVVWNQELTDRNPELIVLLLGFWEDKVVGEASRAAPGWSRRYRTRVVEPFLDLLTRRGARVLWIGMAAVVDPEITRRLIPLNAAYEAAAEQREDVGYLPGGEYLSGPDGGFAEIVDSPVTGAPIRLRRPDGLHLCPEGITALATPVLDRITRQWNVRGAYGWQQGTWREPPLLHAPEGCPTPV